MGYYLRSISVEVHFTFTIAFGFLCSVVPSGVFPQICVTINFTKRGWFFAAFTVVCAIGAIVVTVVCSIVVLLLQLFVLLEQKLLQLFVLLLQLFVLFGATVVTVVLFGARGETSPTALPSHPIQPTFNLWIRTPLAMPSNRTSKTNQNLPQSGL